MAFNVFAPKRVMGREPKIAILPTGIFWINFTAAKKFFKSFKRTYLVYDKHKRLVGFRPSNEQTNTYSLSTTESRNDCFVSGSSFLHEFKIPLERRTYKARWNDSERLVEIDLNQPL